MPSREYIMLVQETSFGIAKTSPVKNTDLFYLRLDGSNAMSLQMNPVIEDVPYGGGRVTPAFPVSDTFACTGSLKCCLYAGAISKFLCDWGMTVINTGRTTPWVTTDAAGVMQVGDLASVSIYHAVQMNDSTYNLRRYSGVKVSGGTIDISRQSPIARLSLDLIGQRDDTNGAGTVALPDATEFPAPGETDYQTNPYLFSHSATGFKVGTTRTQYSTLSFKWSNALDPKFFESRYPVFIKFCGRRSSTISSKMHLKVSPDDLAAFQGLTVQDTELTLSNGTNTLKFDLNAKNYIKGLDRDLPIDKVYERNMMTQNYWDPAIPGDVVITAT